MYYEKETFIEEDTRYRKHCTQDNDTSVPFKVGTLGPLTVLLVAISCPVVFPWILLQSEIPSLSEVILVWEKPEVTGCQIWAVVGLSHLGDLMFRQKTFHKTWCMSGWVAMMKLPTAAAFWIIPNSFHGGMFKLHAKFDADSWLCSHFLVRQPHSTHAHSVVSTAPTD